MKNFIALSGLPRTGSTLLASILFQNPNIHTEGGSGLYRLMYDMEVSFETNSSLWIKGSNRQDVQGELISQIPHIYYNNTTAQNVFDKNVAWVFPGSIELIEKYIRSDPKIIAMIRPVEEIIQSFITLRKLNNWQGDIESDLRDPQNPLIGLAAFWVEQAQLRNDDKFLFIQYDDLVDHTKDVLKSIYDFCEIEYFEHDLNNIENKNPENDEHWGLVGLHDIRRTISRREY
jgi:sulfotransferase